MMKIRKAYKFRLKVTEEVEAKLTEFSGHCRFVYNKVWAINQDRLRRKLPILWYQEMAFWLRLWKQSDEYGFLKDCHSQLLQQKLQDLDKAYRDGFDKNQPNKRLPTPRKRYQHDSFRYPQGVKIENRRIYLPKIGWVGFHCSQPIKGIVKNVTIKRTGNHWSVAIQVEQPWQQPTHPSTSSIGIDLGINNFAALSDGQLIAPLSRFRQLEGTLKQEQQRLSRKKKFSMNWKKQRAKIRQEHERIANARRDFLHKTSTHLSKSHAMIVVEDLKIRQMSKSAKGTVDEPGRNVSAKSGLNKSILDQGWSEFCRQLGYKLTWLGGELLKVNPRNTSLRCSSCHHTSKANRPDQARFCCEQCGHQDHADINAAKNILVAGHAILACGSNDSCHRKQEPLGIGNLVPA